MKYLVLLLLLMPGVLGSEDEMTFGGIDLDEPLNLLSGLLAIALFVITYIAYKRDKRKKLFIVLIAFLLFAIKSLVTASEYFYPEMGGWIETVANFLDFAVLLCFFFGVIKK